MTYICLNQKSQQQLLNWVRSPILSERFEADKTNAQKRTEINSRQRRNRAISPTPAVPPDLTHLSSAIPAAVASMAAATGNTRAIIVTVVVFDFVVAVSKEGKPEIKVKR